MVILIIKETETVERRLVANLSEQLSNYTNQNEELESELEAAQIELNKLRVDRETPQGSLSKKRKLDDADCNVTTWKLTPSEDNSALI
jgi:SMC interacting uncharacterized protein involved in chromosome segregation